VIREPGVCTLENHGSCEMAASCRIEQRREIAADDVRWSATFTARCGRKPASLRAMLVERRSGHAVRKPFHDEWAIRNGWQKRRRHLRVVAEEGAFRQLLFRPEDLAEVRDRHLHAARKLQRPIAGATLDRIKLFDDARDVRGARSRPRGRCRNR
jgi:hypothetical protein